MMQAADEKGALERAAVEQFAEIFSALVGRGHLRFHALLPPPQPDAHCFLSDADIYIEVAHIYGTDADARRILGRTGYAEPSHEEQLHSSLVPLNHRVISQLNMVLAQKSKKTYTSSPIWLVVRNAFPLWKDTDFQRHRNQIQVPASCPFSEIWLVCGPRVDFGLMRLDNAA